MKTAKVISIAFIYIMLICAGSVLADDQLNIEITIQDHKFYPDIIEIPAGKKVKLIIHNKDNTIEEFDSVDLKREKIIPAHSVAYIVLAPLQPGVYYFIGEFNSATAQGKIIVN